MRSRANREGLLAAVAVLALAGCSGNGAPSGPGSPAPSGGSLSASSPAPATTAPAAPETKVVEITVKGRGVSPPPGRVEIAKGEKVRLVVHADRADEIHVHGYDLEAKMGPGQDAVIEFVASQPGLFEVETHESHLLLTQLAVR